MGDEGITQQRQGSLAAPFVFLIVASLQFAYHWIDHLKKNGSDNNAREAQLRGEIKQLLHEASLMSQPATFAQAAKLRRLAAAKERELGKYQSEHQHRKDYASYSKVMLVAKYIIYALLLLWFWRVPVASISQQLVQPFGRLLSWKTTGVQENHAMVGIISWLIVSARVCRFVRRAYNKQIG